MTATNGGPAGRVRRSHAAVALAAAARFMTSILMGTAMAVYVGRAGSELAVSLVLTAYFLGLTLFAPAWGAVADVTGRRRAVLVVTGTLATAVTLPLTVVDGVWAQIGLRGVYAVFAAGFLPVALAIVSERGGREGRGRSIGTFNSARAVGFTGGQVFAGTLLGLLAPTELYGVIAGLSLASTLAAALVTEGERAPAGGEPPTLRRVAAAVRRRLLPTAADRSHLRRNGLRWLYLALAMRNMTVLGVMSLMPVYLTREVGLTELAMGLVLAINPAGQVVCMVLFGRVADAVGRKPLVVGGMAASGGFALVAAAATALPATALATVAVGRTTVAIGPRGLVAAGSMALIAVAFSAMATGALAFIGDVAPAERESELMGLRSTAKGLGGVLGPPILGAIATVATVEAAYVAGSALALVAAGIAALGLVETAAPRGSATGVAGDD